MIRLLSNVWHYARDHKNTVKWFFIYLKEDIICRRLARMEKKTIILDKWLEDNQRRRDADL